MTKATSAFALLFLIAAGEAVWIGYLLDKNKPCTQYWRVSCGGIHYVEVPTTDTTTIIQQSGQDGIQPCSNIFAQGNVNVECKPEMKQETK